MTDREKVIRLAEKVMGWKQHQRQGMPVGWLEFRKPDRAVIVWTPLESIADAFEMEGALPEGKRDEYLRTLWQILADMKAPWNSQFAGYWYFVHATPRQRCEAALAVMGDEWPA